MLDDDMEFDVSENGSNQDGLLLEDIFLKGRTLIYKDPFLNKDDVTSTAGQSTNKSSVVSVNSNYSKFSNLTNSTANSLKYQRLPNGMIINHDIE